MVYKRFLTIFTALVIVVGMLIFAIELNAQESLQLQVQVVTITVCGNGVVESGEQCDAGGSNGACPATCSASCTFNSCGGGGGGYVAPPIITQVIFSGRAYPLSKVVVLKDGQIAISTIAGPDANFYAELTGLSSGNYNFAIYGEDNQGKHSTLFTFSIFITQGATTKISGIFIAPTIAVDKEEVKKGENIAIFGQSVPNSEITISVNSDEEFFNKVIADANGVYLYNFDTSPLEMEQHFTKSKSAYNGEISSFSRVVSFSVGTKTVLKEKPEILKGDSNSDGRVNLIDFSISAYWYKRPSPPASVDLNGDGEVNLVDFSIMAFYWTG